MRERGLVDTALTRASRRLQKTRNRRAACPLPGQGEGSSELDEQFRMTKPHRSSYVESVAEVADAGEDHREAAQLGEGDELLDIDLIGAASFGISR